MRIPGTAPQAWCAVASLGVALAWAGPVHAEPWTLKWTAPTGCPQAEEVRADVERLLAREPDGPLVVEATVTEAPSSFSLAIAVDGVSAGERDLSATSCDTVARAAALLIAMSIDPEAVAQAAAPPAPPEPPPAPEPPAPEPPAPEPPQAARPEDEDAPAEAPKEASDAPWRVAIEPWLGALMEQALVPGAGLGVGAGVGVEVEWLRVSLGGGVVPNRSTSVPLAEGRRVGAQMTAWQAQLEVCGRIVDEVVTLHGCVLAREQWLDARGFGADEPDDVVGAIFAAGGGARLAWRFVPWLGVEGVAHAIVPVTRPSFVIEDVTTVYRPAAVGAAARLGLVATFDVHP